MVYDRNDVGRKSRHVKDPSTQEEENPLQRSVQAGSRRALGGVLR